MSSICVRAGLGTQVFQFLIGLLNDEALTDIHWHYPYVNTANKKLRPDLGKEFYVERLYNLNDFHIHKNSNRTDLIPPINRQNIEAVSKYINLIRSKLKEKFEIRPNNLSLLHERGWDTPLLSKAFYERIKEKYKLNSISDSDKNDDGSLTDACYDFVKLYNANECVGAWSMMTISAAVLNPKMNLNIIHHEYWSDDIHGGIDRMRMCKDLSNIFIENFPNINWWNLE